MLHTVRRWFLLTAGLTFLTYALAPVASAASAGAPAVIFGPRDLINLLIAMLLTIGGAFFAGAKKDIERRLESLEEQSAELNTSLLSNYLSKNDLIQRFEGVERAIEKELASTRQYMDSLLAAMKDRK